MKYHEKNHEIVVQPKNDQVLVSECQDGNIDSFVTLGPDEKYGKDQGYQRLESGRLRVGSKMQLVVSLTYRKHGSMHQT